MADKGNELIQYITEQVVSYYETPKEIRKQQRRDRKQAVAPWPNRWFGMLPFAFSMWMEKRKKKK